LNNPHTNVISERAVAAVAFAFTTALDIPRKRRFDSDTDLQFFDALEMLVNDRRFFIYNFRRDATEDEAAEDEAAENGDFGREAAEDEASEDEVDGVTVNYDIPSPPVDQHCSNLEVALQTIQMCKST